MSAPQRPAKGPSPEDVLADWNVFMQKEIHAPYRVFELAAALRTAIAQRDEARAELRDFIAWVDHHGDFRNGVTDGDRVDIDEGNVLYAARRREALNKSDSGEGA